MDLYSTSLLRQCRVFVEWKSARNTHKERVKGGRGWRRRGREGKHSDHDARHTAVLPFCCYTSFYITKEPLISYTYCAFIRIKFIPFVRVYSIVWFLIFLECSRIYVRFKPYKYAPDPEINCVYVTSISKMYVRKRKKSTKKQSHATTSAK